MKKVLGMGNALVDILMQLNDDAVLQQLSLPKGSMQLVDEKTANQILKATDSYEKSIVSGGSASNTIHGLAALGIETDFIGKTRDDKWGELYESDMKKRNINPILFKGKNETGRAITFISQDSERTFATYLGAAIELSSDDLSSELFNGYDYFHTEGYLVQNRELIETALKFAKSNNLKTSLDLASFNVVAENREFLLEMVEKYVDILFANEEEAREFTGGLKNEEALDFMGELCEYAILKQGKNGSIIKHNGKTIKVDIVPAKSIDTTGAGDLYASGFLYGLINSLPVEKCGQIGSLTSATVIEVIGPKISDNKWNEIKDSEKMRF